MYLAGDDHQNFLLPPATLVDLAGSGPSSVKSRRVDQFQVYYTVALFS